MARRRPRVAAASPGPVLKQSSLATTAYVSARCGSVPARFLVPDGAAAELRAVPGDAAAPLAVALPPSYFSQTRPQTQTGRSEMTDARLWT
jgi:hypothetical protein